MTEIAMPDPVAYAHRDILRRGNCVERIYPTAKHGSESVGLITTDQAEAYANARVREALEEAAQITDGFDHFATCDAIRALLPSR